MTESEPIDFSAPVATEADVELLQTIASLTTSQGAPSLSQIARCYGITRQAIHKKVVAMRGKGLVEAREPDGRGWGVVMTHNGKLLAATGACP